MDTPATDLAVPSGQHICLLYGDDEERFLRPFDGRTILAVLEVHPYLLLRGQVLRYPNYVRDARVRWSPGHVDARPA